nr:glycerol acyltransferase [Alphaproteobacteria bacterium]
MKTSSIWAGRKFTPLWISQSLSALNDNIFRYAFNTALMFGIINIPEGQAKLWVSLSAAFFILPYLLFSGLAGQLADKYPKASLLRI